jgi:hypothetical protein
MAANDSERLKWAEENGLKNLQEKFTTADNMNKEAQTTLTYVLAGMGGTFLYALPGVEKQLTVTVAGAIVACFYFVILGIYLVARTFFISDFPSPYQRPENLLINPSEPTDEIRAEEIENITERIDKSKAWIVKKAKAINVVRAALVVSPLTFVIGCGIFKYFQ